jgi:hypothetical protein
MTDKEKAIIKNIKSQVSKHYGKWCIKRVDVEIAIARGMYGDKYGKDMWRHQMNAQEKADADKVFEGMMKQGLIRYTTQPKRNRDAGGSINYHMNMIVEKKFWDLFNQVKEA